MATMTIGRYMPYQTWMHKLDPRLKLFALITFMITIFIRFNHVLTDLFLYGVIFIIIAILMKITKLTFRQLFKQLKALWVMLIFLLMINILIPNTQDITDYFLVLGFRIYYAALLQTFYIVFRLVLMIALTLILTA